MIFRIKLYLHLNRVLLLNWIVWNRTIFIKMDLALNNLQRLICNKTKTTNQPTTTATFFFFGYLRSDSPIRVQSEIGCNREELTSAVNSGAVFFHAFCSQKIKCLSSHGYGVWRTSRNHLWQIICLSVCHVSPCAVEYVQQRLLLAGDTTRC